MDLTKLVALSAVFGGVMPFVAALAQLTGADRWNRLVRVVLAGVATVVAAVTVCPVIDWQCVVTSAAVIVAAAESTYRAWTRPAVDALAAATSPKAKGGTVYRAPSER